MKKWPLQDIYFWNKAPFFRLLLPLIAGILAYSFVDVHLNVFLFSGLFSFCAFIVTTFINKLGSGIKTIQLIALQTTLVAMGLVLCYYNDIRNDKGWFANERSEAYVARLSAEPVEKDKTWKLEVDVINTKEAKATVGKGFIYVYKNKLPLMFHEGDTIIIPNKWQPIKTAGNPYEFDYARYCALNNIYYQQFLALDDVVLYAHVQPDNLPFTSRVHHWCMHQLAKYIPDRSALGLMQAMLIGDEANLDSELRQAYSETGIIHIIAISGSHITFFFLIIAFLLSWIKHQRWKWLKYLAAIPLIWVYVMMSGAPPSAVRAAIMFSVFAIGLAYEKQPNSLNQLLATAFILLVAQPNWLYAIGFQLSFLAVLSLVLFYKPIYKLYTPPNRLIKALWATIAASLAAEILIAPVAVYYFHLFPLLFIVANVLAYLFMGVVLIAGMCLIAVSPFASVAVVLGYCITGIAQFFNNLVYGMQNMNPQPLHFLQVDFIELILLFIVIIGIAVFILREQKAGLFTGLTAMSLLLLSFCYNEWTALHQRKLVVYNISKANHIELIEGKYHEILYTDTTANAKNKNYILKPAHTGFRAWRDKQYNGNKETLLINGQSVLILNAPINNIHQLHLDYVIINYHPELTDFARIQEAFAPRQIVLGSKVSRKEVTEWTEACNQQNISLYSVSEKGAFVL
jgi:competence protein ComEC